MSDEKTFDAFPNGNIQSQREKSGENLTEREREYRSKFPEEWICPYCIAQEMKTVRIPRDEILAHVTGEHGDDVKPGTTWEQFYNRMVQVGGL